MGILAPKAYTMLDIIALVTTFMTGPLLSALRLPKPSLEPNPREKDLVVAGD